MVPLQTQNDPAIRFFQRHGFAFCGFNDRYYSSGSVGLYLDVSFAREEGRVKSKRFRGSEDQMSECHGAIFRSKRHSRYSDLQTLKLPTL